MAQSTSDEMEDDGEPVEQPVVERYKQYLRYDQVLGRGAFKTVYKAFDEENAIEVAWNQVRVTDLVSCKEDKERLFAEIRVLKQLKHKNIMTFYDSWLDQKTHTVNFITELFTSGTLRQYRRRHRNLDPEVFKTWAWQTLCGLVYLHGHTPPIIHRDLKCDNLFINGCEGIVKIGDLGLATLLRARTAPQSVLGTPEFMAPELWEEQYDARVDVYSFGMCLLELATFEYPYSECKNPAQIYRKLTLGIRPAALQKVASQELAEFIALCICPIAERPHARQLLKHPFFNSIRACRGTRSLGHSHTFSSDYMSSTNLVGLECPFSGTSSVTGDILSDPETHEHVPEPLVTKQDTEAQPYIRSPTRHRTVSATSDAFNAALQQLADSKEGRSVPPDAGTIVPIGGEREFRVQGHLKEDAQQLNLRLRILQPDGTAKVVEFDYNLAEDTAMSVAAEMVDEMSLSRDDAQHIAAAIFQEINELTHASDASSDRHPAGPRSVALSHCAGMSEVSEGEPASATAPASLRASSELPASRQYLPGHQEPAELVTGSQERGMRGADAPSGSESPGLTSKVHGMGPAQSLSAWLDASTPLPPSRSFSFGQAQTAAVQPPSPPHSLAADAGVAGSHAASQHPHAKDSVHLAVQAVREPDAEQQQQQQQSYRRRTTSTSPRSSEQSIVGQGGSVDRQVLSQMLSTSQVDRRLPMQKLFEHLEDHFIVDKRDGCLHLSNGTTVPLDSITLPSPPLKEWTSPNDSLAPSDCPPHQASSDPGHLPGSLIAAGQATQPWEPLRVDTSPRSTADTPGTRTPELVSCTASPRHRTASPTHFSREGCTAGRHAEGFLTPQPGPGGRGRRTEGFLSPQLGQGGCLRNARSASERELRRKLAADAASARMRDFEAKFQGLNGLSNPTRSGMRGDGQPLNKSMRDSRSPRA